MQSTSPRWILRSARRTPWKAVVMGLAGAFLLGGCSPTPSTTAASKTSTSPPPAQATAPKAPLHLDHAQPKLDTLKLYVGPFEVTAELALTRTQVATGMMFRETMKEEEGMLFVFPRPHQTGFYMKNTKVPLTAAYIDPEGTILELHDLEPLDEDPVLAATDQVQYVLEMKQGWFKRHNISEGAFIRTERGTLPETFSRRQGP